jgi:phospholipase C
MPDLRSLIDTIVVVMMENRSFDHMLGFLSHEAFGGRTDVDGLHRPSDRFDWDNADDQGNLYAPTATPDGYLPCDLPHSRERVATELAAGAMNGFIKAYFASQSLDKSPVPMRFCQPEDIPITAALAQNYTVCDRWFASLPDDTWPNRLMALAGTTKIDSTSVLKPPFSLLPDQSTVFDWLEGKGVPFQIFVDADEIDDVGPPSGLLLMKSQWKHVVRHAHTLNELEGQWRDGSPAPGLIYCEPFFNDFAIAISLHGNCNHPPLPVAYGEAFLRRIYAALTANPAKWARTALVICYDEHGGFFDHVNPPTMKYAAPEGNAWVKKDPFTTLGVRVPGLVVSPLVEAGSVFHGLLDHTSILQLMVERFGTSGDLKFFGDAVARKNNRVLSLGNVITRASPRTDTVVLPEAPEASTGAATTPALTGIARIFRTVVASKPKATVT